MPDDVSREVKLAISYLKDAENRFENIKRNDNEYILMREVENLISYEIAKAQQRLKNANDDKEIIHTVQVQITSFLAKTFATITDRTGHLKKLGGTHTNTWAKWAYLAVQKYYELVTLNPKPATYYLYGFALLEIDQYKSARDTFVIVENGDDEELSIEATKLIVKIDERINKK